MRTYEEWYQYANQKKESGIKHHLELLDSVRSELNSKINKSIQSKDEK